MKYYYSVSSNSFYAEGMLDVYRESSTLPEDLHPLSEEEYQSLYTAINSGYTATMVGGEIILREGEKGDNCADGERAWRDSELRWADVELLKVQDSDTNAKGSVGGWRQYRRELRAWPEHKDFPNKGARPKAPTAE